MSKKVKVIWRPMSKKVKRKLKLEVEEKVRKM